MPRMWTQESQLTGLSASRWNKTTQENKSNPCTNHPAYSEAYITHQCALAKLLLRLCWNLNRPDSLCTFNHTSFASPFQPASFCVWKPVSKFLPVQSSLISLLKKRELKLSHLVHTAALLCFTHLANTEARDSEVPKPWAKQRRT